MTKTGYSEYDYLALLLGALSLDTFLDNLPADSGVCDGWESISMKYSEALEKTIAFLTMYEDEFGCNFKNTKQFLLQPQSKELKEILES